MRICLVNTYHHWRGGDSTYAFELARLLGSRGHQVIHFAMKHPKNFPSEFEKYFVDYIDYRDLSETGGLFERVKAFPRSLYSSEARRKFAALLDATSPDIVHLQNFRRHLTFSILPEPKKRAKPVVMTAHDYDLICPRSVLFAHGALCDRCRGRNYYNAAIARCKGGSFAGSAAIALEAYFMRVMGYDDLLDMIITPSRFARDKLVECGRPAARIRALPNFIDGSRYRPVYDNDGYAICFGRLSDEKGIEVLLEAAAGLPDVRLVIAGDGPCRTALEGQALKLGLKNAEFLGHVARDKILDLVSRAMFVVIPSICPENFPYSVLEAFAVGKPVIASRIGGLPEMVENGGTGLLVEPGDPADLAKKMACLAENRALLREMGENARKRIETEFDAATHYRNIMQVYEELSA